MHHGDAAAFELVPLGRLAQIDRQRPFEYDEDLSPCDRRTIDGSCPRLSSAEAELALVRDFVASVSDGATAFVLEGEAGVGKTTVWSAGIAEADDQGLLILQSRPAESETACRSRESAISSTQCSTRR